MNFPLLNISESKWIVEDLMEYIDFDGFFYSSSFDLFEKYQLGKQFCDCDGNVFEVVGKTPPKEWWKKTFRFIPNLYKEKLVYKKTGEIDLDEFRDYVIQRVQNLKKDEFRDKWIEQLKAANSYYEIIYGQIKKN